MQFKPLGQILKTIEREIWKEFECKAKMFAILEKRIVAGVVAAISLVANLAVFVFLGLVGATILIMTSISIISMILATNTINTKLRNNITGSALFFCSALGSHHHLRLLHYPFHIQVHITFIVFMTFVNWDFSLNSGLSLTTICLKNGLTPYGLYFR